MTVSNIVPFTINNVTNRSVARTQYKELSWQWVWLMQRSLCRVKGQNQWSMLPPNCRAPLHPHNFKELEKTGELPESAKYEEGSFQLLQHGVEHSILSFYYWTWIACTFKKKKFSVETQFLKSPGSMQLVNVNKRPWQEHVNYIECHALGLSASNIVELFH